MTNSSTRLPQNIICAANGKKKRLFGLLPTTKADESARFYVSALVLCVDRSPFLKIRVFLNSRRLSENNS